MYTKTRYCLLALACCLLMLGCTATPAFLQREANDDILRLHVIANSDSAIDQSVKLEVRDAILAVMEAGESKAEATAFVRENGGLLLDAAERVLHENGFAYPVQLMLGRFAFPDRTYGDAFYPAGEYDALRVVLGDGAGQNWWCVLFPPLCIVTEEPQELDLTNIRFKSSILEWLRKKGVIA